MKPHKGVKTSVKGWMNNPENLQYDEKVEITRGIKSSATNAKILINLTKKEVVRNGFNSDRDFKSLFKYFFGGYHKYITEVMGQIDPVFLTEILDELQEEMEADEATVQQIFDTPVEIK